MPLLSAVPDIVVIDADVGQMDGSTTVSYEKEEFEELWERPPGSGWSRINVHVRTGQGDEADRRGSFPVTLRPGDKYELGVFNRGNTPLDPDPVQLAKLLVYGLLKRPGQRNLIVDTARAFGGTWCFHRVATNVPTDIVEIAVSRTAAMVDADGIPHAQKPDGAVTTPLVTTMFHGVQIEPIFPGNTCFFSVLVVDAAGNWDMRMQVFNALRRIIDVQFPTLHVYNDGDPFDVGEGEFWFRIQSGPQYQPRIVEEFHRGTQDIDDWNETDRPYGLGFAHVGQPMVVAPEDMAVSVTAWGVEHDGFLEADEGAWGSDVTLPFPVGVGETVTGAMLTLDCPASTDGDDFHFGVDVVWSVRYVI